MIETIRYAIQITRPQFPNPSFVARPVGLNSEGGAATFLEDAKTWGTSAGAQRWIDARPDWVSWRIGQRQTVKVVAVRMKRGSYTVPVALAA